MCWERSLSQHSAPGSPAVKRGEPSDVPPTPSTWEQECWSHAHLTPLQMPAEPSRVILRKKR